LHCPPERLTLFVGIDLGNRALAEANEDLESIAHQLSKDGKVRSVLSRSAKKYQTSAGKYLAMLSVINAPAQMLLWWIGPRTERELAEELGFQSKRFWKPPLR
jgi:hypothetical protein